MINTLGCVAYGAAAWAAGIVFIRTVKTSLLSNPTSKTQLTFLAAIIPTSYLTVKLLKPLGLIDGQPGDISKAIVVGSAAAQALDAISWSFFPKESYNFTPGETGGTQAMSGLLWGLATISGFGYYLDK